jgi:nucleoside-diphosphate-sugar epimerase
MKVLIIGGTRNLGPSLIKRFLERGDEVTVFNRGITPGALPKQVEQLKGDRTRPEQLRAAVAGRDFDAVVDTTLYKGDEAKAAIEIFSGHVGRYIFISTGQVYLVREGLKKPYKEQDYAGSVMPEPPQQHRYDYENWVYGADKRAAEDAFTEAWESERFPFVSLRLPMVHSERDHYHRMEGYLLRLRDGGPILLPVGEDPLVRHVYGEDVVASAEKAISTAKASGRAYNICQNEVVPLSEFLRLLAEMANAELRIQYVPRAVLENHALIPDCSPFSGTWMSMLANQRSIDEMGMRYTPLDVYLRRLVEYFSRNRNADIPGYKRRDLELQVANTPS